MHRHKVAYRLNNIGLWLDGLMFFVALCLLGYTCTWTESYVLSAMTFGMLVVCVSAAWKRQHERAKPTGNRPQ